jgi:hypothetical protein
MIWVVECVRGVRVVVVAEEMQCVELWYGWIVKGVEWELVEEKM